MGTLEKPQIGKVTQLEPHGAVWANTRVLGITEGTQVQPHLWAEVGFPEKRPLR